MPELELTAEQTKSIRTWAGKNGHEIVSVPIDRLGTLHVIDGEPLLALNGGFKNINGTAVQMTAVLTSEKIVKRMESEGIIANIPKS